MQKAQVHSIIQKVCLKMSELFGDKLKSVILFGSYARGDFDAESDIDFMVIVDIDKSDLSKFRHKIITFLRPIEFENEILISIHLQDLKTFDHWRNDLPFYMNVIKEGITVSV